MAATNADLALLLLPVDVALVFSFRETRDPLGGHRHHSCPDVLG